jgi:tetratricopeptide (TPR) repeat protein
MIKIYFFTFIFFVLSFYGNAEDCSCNAYSDKKRNEFQKRIDNSEFSKAEKIALSYISNSKIACQLTGYDQMVVIYMHQGKFDSAKIYLDKQKPLIKKLPCNKNAKMEYLTSMAEYYFINDDLKKGAELTTQALEIAEDLKNYNRQALLYSYLSNAFSRLEMIDKQIEYARRGSEIISKIEEPRDAINHIRSIANSYKSHFWKLNNNASLDTMIFYGREVLNRSRKLNYHNGIIDGLLLFNEYESALKNYANALIYIDSASNILKNSTEVTRAYQYWYKIYFDKSFCYHEMGNGNEAARFADSTLKYSLITDQTVVIASSYKKGFEAYRLKGDYKKALDYFETYVKMRDSMNTIENKEIVTELEQKYEKVKNKKTIKEQKQQNELLQKENAIQQLNNQFLLITIIAAVLLILLLIIILRQRQIRNKQEVMEIEMRLNRSRMNPHFFFNALTSLQGLAVRENDGKKLATRLFQFSGLMRQSLESTYTNFISIEEEISFLEKYLEVSKIRDENLFSYKIECINDLEPENLLLPSMLLQPFVENSIEHGFKRQDRKGELEITFDANKSQLLIQIKDNGPGLGNGDKKENHISRATQITKDRIYLLNQNKKGNYHFEISNRSDTTGVIVKIYLPLQYRNENISNR